MQSIGATATIVPALVAGASATGIAGAVESGQGQPPGENGGEREPKNEESQEEKQEGDPEKQGEIEAKEHSDNGKPQRPSLSERLQKLVRVPSPGPCNESGVRVASPNENQGLVMPLPDVSHDGEVYRPKNNQR
jgi:hypothetical protein